MAAESPPGSNSHSHSPSPGRPRHRKKPKDDPFLSLPDVPTSASPSPDRSPGSENRDPFEDQFSEPLLTRLFLTPVLCASFVLSLFIVDRRNRQWRASQRCDAQESSVWDRLSPSSWLGPEPYGDSVAAVDGARDPHASRDGGRWYVKKKHRKMGKMALDDAFELRSSVIVAMIVVWAVLLLSILWVGKKIWNRLAA